MNACLFESMFLLLKNAGRLPSVLDTQKASEIQIKQVLCYCSSVHTHHSPTVKLAFKKLNLNNNNNNKPFSCDFSLTRTLAINICFPEKQQEKIDLDHTVLCICKVVKTCISRQKIHSVREQEKRIYES